jgi:hypothetical protein
LKSALPPKLVPSSPGLLPSLTEPRGGEGVWQGAVRGVLEPSAIIAGVRNACVTDPGAKDKGRAPCPTAGDFCFSERD